MNILFIIYHDLSPCNGISKKILAQVEALRRNGHNTHIAFMEEGEGWKRRTVDQTTIAIYDGGLRGKILKRTDFRPLVDYARNQKIEMAYVRHDHNSNPFTIRLLRQLRQAGIRIAMEIPTYPYDREYHYLPLSYQPIILIDKLFRRQLAKCVDYIVTFSDHETIWKRPTIQISNGIDFDTIRQKSTINTTDNEINLIGVATMHPWHGFDRAIRGLAEYYQQSPDIQVYFHIVGVGVPRVVDEYKRLVAENKLEQYVIFYSALHGEALDAVFERADIGIGSLARHRSRIDKIKTLKNREYAARGIPFVYSETDDDFEHRPYIMKVSADDTPLDIRKLISFYRSIDPSPGEIRKSVLDLSWEIQMQHVVEQTFNTDSL